MFVVLLDDEGIPNNVTIARQFDSTLWLAVRKRGTSLAAGRIPFDRVQPSRLGQAFGIGEGCLRR